MVMEEIKAKKPFGQGKEVKFLTRVGNTIKKTGVAIEAATELYEKLSDKQRKLFVSLTQGDDELIACLKCGQVDNFKAITKIAYTKEGRPFKTANLTLKNVDNLDAASYERLLRICKSDIKNHLLGFEYEKSLIDVTNLFKLIAPEALSVLAKVASDDKAKDRDRVSAANSILDRGGYTAGDVKKGAGQMPVKINILFNAAPKAEILPTINYGVDDDSGAGDN
jgi:hypothetical protein